MTDHQNLIKELTLLATTPQNRAELAELYTRIVGNAGYLGATGDAGMRFLAAIYASAEWLSVPVGA